MNKIQQLEAEIEYLYTRLTNKEKFIYLLRKRDVNLKEDKICLHNSQIFELRQQGFEIEYAYQKYTYTLLNKDHVACNKYKYK